MKRFPSLLAACTLALSLLSPTAFARGGGSEAGNGGGLAEKYLEFAFLNLETLASPCSQSPLCGLSASERAILESIRRSHAQELGSGEGLVFLSGRTRPGFFFLDGAVRIARTLSRVGEPIHINRDLLYRDTPDGSEATIDLPLAASILIHELGHHHGIGDHSLLDRIGSRVQAYLRLRMARLDLVPNPRSRALVGLTLLQRAPKEGSSTLWVSDSRRDTDLTPALLERVRCPGPDEELIALEISRISAESESVEPLGTVDGGELYRLIVGAEAWAYCRGKGDTRPATATRQQLHLGLRFHVNGIRSALDPAALEFEQLPCRPIFGLDCPKRSIESGPTLDERFWRKERARDGKRGKAK